MAEENKEDIKTSLLQSQEVQKEKERIFSIVYEDKQRRDQVTTFFRNATLSQYTEAGIGQFIGFREKPEYKKGYQYNLFDPVTRDKVMAIISKTAGMYEAEFFNTNKRLAKISETIATVLGAFYKDSTRRLKEKEKNKLTMLAALITPKAIWYEGWKYQKRAIREIEERDPETSAITKTKKKEIVHYNGPYGELCEVEDIIPGSLKERDLQEQPHWTWIPKMQMSTFKRLFPSSKYPEAKKVRSHGRLIENDMTDWTIRNDLKETEVEVLHFYEKWEDKMTIIANGIQITPIDHPMPFAHKDYPFTWGGFEELSPFFIYDMPLTMKLLDMQDMNNEILSLSLDMVWRALNEVILVKSGDDFNADVLETGGMVDVDDPKNFQKFDFGSSFGFNSAREMREAARRSIESSSLDAPQSGQSGSRAITAREAMIAREAALEITTLFLQNMENMEADKARLRVKNQLDRYHRPVEWEERIGEDGTKEAIKVFRELSIRGTKLDGGKRGTANINITEAPRPKNELDKVNVENDKEMSQTIDVSPELIRMIDFDVEIVANSSVKNSKELQKAEARAFMQDAAAMPNVLSVDYAAEEYVKKLGYKKDEALVKKEDNPMKQLLSGSAPPGKGEAVKSPLGEDSLESMLNAQF